MSGVLLSIAVAQVLTILVGLLRAKGLALLLGPAGFGVVSTIDQVVVTVVTLGGLALPFTAMKFLSRGHSQGDDAFRRTGSGFLRLLVLLAAVATLTASVLVATRPGTFGRDLVAWQGTLQVAIWAVPSAMLLIFFVNVTAASQRPAAAAAINFLGVAILAVAGVLGAYWRGIAGLYQVSVVAAIFTTVVGLWYLSRRLGIGVRSTGGGVLASLRARPEILGYSACFYAMMGANSTTLLIIRTTVLSRLGEVAAGELQAALSVALTVGAVLLPISNLYLAPLVNRAAPVAEKVRTANDFASRMLVLLLLGALPVVLVPGLLLRMLFSAAFVPAAVVIWSFVLWQCVFQLVYVYQQLLVGLDDVLAAATWSVLGFLASIALAGPLIGRVGLGGVALALAAGTTLSGVGMLLRLRRRHIGLVSRSVALRFGGVAGCVVLAGQLFAKAPENSPVALLSRLGFAAVAIGGAWLMLEPQERNPREWIAAVRRGRGGTTSP